MPDSEPIQPDPNQIARGVLSSIEGLRDDTAAAVTLKLVTLLRRFPGFAADTERLTRLAWVLARNFEIDEARHRDVVRRSVDRLIHQPAQEQPPLPDAALQTAIDEAVSRLDADERLLVQFRIVNGLTLAQIAEITGTYPSAISRSFARVLDTIKQTLIAHAKNDAELRDALRARGIIP